MRDKKNIFSIYVTADFVNDITREKSSMRNCASRRKMRKSKRHEISRPVNSTE